MSHATSSRLSCLALLLLALQVPADELVLESVKTRDASGEIELRTNGRRAAFDLDVARGVLRASGTWYATHVQPNGMGRLTHKVEDMTASADGELSMRSYECVEGFFGPQFLVASACGNYDFGPNQIDEGGLVDDRVKGPPVDLHNYGVSQFEWNGESLHVVLSTDGSGEQSITLVLVRPPATSASR